MTFPLSGASVDMDFTSGQYYSSDGNSNLTDQLAISRASVGYAKNSSGVLVPFASGKFRITDLGLLIEDSRINIAKNSGDLTGASWGVQNATVSTSGTAPDGTSSCLVTEGVGTNVAHSAYDITTADWTSGTTYAASCFVTNISGNYCFLNFQGNDANCWISAVFDLTAGEGSATQTAVGATSGTIVSTSIESWGNGLYRCILVGSFAASGNTAYVEIGGAPTATGNTFNAAGELLYTVASGGKQLFYAWGMQLEAGSFASSYIPVGAVAAVTRAMDVVTTQGSLSSIINATTASALIDFVKLPFSAASVSNGDAMALSRGSTPLFEYALRLRGFTAGDDRNFIMSSATPGGLAVLAPAGLGYSTVGSFKGGSAWNPSGRSISAQGSTVVTDGGVMAATSGDSYVGSNGTVAMCTYIRRLTVWNSRLVDATLQGLTVPSYGCSDIIPMLTKTMSGVARGTVTTGSSTTSILTSALSLYAVAASGVVINQFAGRVVIFDGDTTTAGLRGAQSIIRGSSASNTPIFTVDALPATPANGDIFSVV